MNEEDLALVRAEQAAHPGETLEATVARLARERDVGPPPLVYSFATNPIRIVERTDDPCTYVDPVRGQQTSDAIATSDGGPVAWRLHYSGPLDPEDVAAVEGIARAIAHAAHAAWASRNGLRPIGHTRSGATVARERDAERERCATLLDSLAETERKSEQAAATEGHRVRAHAMRKAFMSGARAIRGK